MVTGGRALANVEKRLGRQVWFSASFNALTAEKIAALYIVAIDILCRWRRSIAIRLEKCPVFRLRGGGSTKAGRSNCLPTTVGENFLTRFAPLFVHKLTKSCWPIQYNSIRLTLLHQRSAKSAEVVESRQIVIELNYVLYHISHIMIEARIQSHT